MNMNDPGPSDRDERFLREVRRQAERTGAGRRPDFWRGLGLIGAVGWMVTLPILLGAFAGRWIDEGAGTGIRWTLSLMAAGLAVGCASAWRHVRREIEG